MKNKNLNPQAKQNQQKIKDLNDKRLANKE